MNDTNLAQPGANKKIYFIIGGFLVVVVVLFLIQSRQKSPSGDMATKGQSKALTASGLPPGFPKDFPIDVTAQTGKGGIQKGPEGKVFLQFTSNLTLEQAFVVYSDYFKNKGWKIFGQMDKPVVKALNAKSPVGDILAVSLSPAPHNKTFVTASLAKSK